ncbi:MAG: S9 family peptidase [Bdellovibrionaceae bacterium]|nr:S9 family peptidase [Pseudobdellovibrionaceae bacterium]
MEFQWLENLESPESLAWVNDQNARTLSELKSYPEFQSFYEEALKVHGSSGRLPCRSIHDGLVYDLQVSEENPLGRWVRCSLQEFTREMPMWEVLLDLDLFSREQGQEWNFSSALLSPKGERVLVALSQGGKDACWVREFDLGKKAFVMGGFEIPVSKARYAWTSEDSLIVGGETPELQNRSGYARVIRIWKRGEDAKPVLLESENEELGFWISPMEGQQEHLFIWRIQNYDSALVWLWTPQGGAQRLHLPSGISSLHLMGETVVFNLERTHGVHAPGSILSVSLKEAIGNESPDFKTVWTSTKEVFFDGFVPTRGGLLVHSKKDVRSRLEFLTPDERGGWKSSPQPIPEGLEIFSLLRDEQANRIFLRMESFFHPPRLMEWTPQGMTLVKSAPSLFDGDYFVVQDWVVGKDGTKIPYFLVRRRDIPLKQEVPTLLYGYGGFEISVTPTYGAALGKLWLEKGGAYVVANIRGGGEFGAEWSLCARKENKQRSYDDFIAVAEALVAQGLTRPSKLAIYGGSNGGLLVGAVAMQRPDLFKAVLCTIPLLDMIRYSEIPPGSLWMTEYGDPRDPAMREVILRYSPYHNIDAKKKYPKIFFMTPRTDDRVHPSHARKMAAKMQSMGKDCFFYEESTGGHGGGRQDVKAQESALKFAYLWKTLTS